MESDSSKLVRLGIKAGVEPLNTEAFHEFIQQVGRCQNTETCDGQVEQHLWDLAVDLKASILEVRTAHKEMSNRLHRLECAC